MTIEDILTEKADELLAMGCEGAVKIYPSFSHGDDNPYFFWTVFVTFFGEKHQISSASSWDEVVRRVKEIVGVDSATSEMLLKL